MNGYSEFIKRFSLLTYKNKYIVANTLSNIFTMREIGNKTHGDLAEIGIVEFINQFMYDYKSKHVGKDLYRAKEHEEDIIIQNELTKEKFPVSLKAYGDGPLQLSTDKNSLMFTELRKYGDLISDKTIIKEIFNCAAFKKVITLNLMPLIYREKQEQCNIMIYDFAKVVDETSRITYVDSGNGRKHPIYLFANEVGDYICEVRYGGASANALQRGLWTHTVKASSYFNSATGGWIDYAPNEMLVRLIMLALNSTKEAHYQANGILQSGIDGLRKNEK
ncbi:MAG: hypothetical protein PHY08_06630 [Candidatus Cloacimonetes bacterium]|nr:hypothetical protein [Candidatus Cloacimonadota bacterium]